jgi:ParB/RepB/Spo0J family partition protein
MSGIIHLEVSQVRHEDGFNVRYDYGDLNSLMHSIVENGVKVPLRGYLHEDGMYVVIDGHRRLRALNKALEEGVPDLKVPFLLVDKEYSDEEKILDMLVTNDGKPLELLEQAEVCSRLKKHGWSNKQIADKWGKSVVHVENMLSLDACSDQTKKHIKQGKISPSLVVDMSRGKSKSETEKAVSDAVKSANGGKVKRKQVDDVSKKYADNGTEALSRLKSELGMYWKGPVVDATIDDLAKAIRYINGEITAKEFYE